MMRGLSVKRGVFLSPMLKFQHIIYEMKDVFFLCLMISHERCICSLSNDISFISYIIC